MKRTLFILMLSCYGTMFCMGEKKEEKKKNNIVCLKNMSKKTIIATIICLKDDDTKFTRTQITFPDIETKINCGKHKPVSVKIEDSSRKQLTTLELTNAMKKIRIYDNGGIKVEAISEK